MKMDRRRFVKRSLAATAAAIFAPSIVETAFANVQPKQILVLGGTHFVGPAFVEAAIANGHTVTLFNRGITNPELFPHQEKLRGFRSSDANNQELTALGRRHFDVAVDVWPNDPDIVATAANFLKDRVGH